MSVTKRMIVLANAVRHAPCRCVAGREVIQSGMKYRFGPWIRPLSSHGEGELAPSETLLAGGGQPMVLDFVEIALLEPANASRQPENWRIDASRRWRSVGDRFKPPPMHALLESPPDLWLDSGRRSDRVEAERLKRKPPRQSLYFVRIDRLRVRFEWKSFEDAFRRRRRAIFRYNGRQYDLAITDPVFHERHALKFPPRGEPAAEIELQSKSGFYVCVSLAHAFNGYHYKVVATILEA